MSIRRNKKQKFPIITNDGSSEPSELLNMIGLRERPEHIKFIMGENEQPGPPIRPAKAKGIAKLSEAMKTQNEERQMWLEDM